MICFLILIHVSSPKPTMYYYNIFQLFYNFVF